MRKFLNRVIDLLMMGGFTVVAGLVATVAISAKDRCITRVRWDGEDWEYKWPGGCLYWGSPLYRAKSITERSMGHLFLAQYQPRSGETVLDVGAGAGTEVCHFSKMVGPSGRVIAVEADPTAARRLRKQASALEYSNVQVLELAVGENSGTVSLHVTADGGVANSTKALVGTSSIAVRCQRLDAVLEELAINRVSYMKMNIEGAEYDALLGLGKAISRIVNFCISCHDFTGDPSQATFEKVRTHLVASGLHVVTLPTNPTAPWERYYLFASQQ